MKLSGSRRISVIGLFVALAIILNLVVKIPAPYAGFLTYEIWEIPIVTAFLLFGFSIALPVAAMNFLILLMFPGVILAGPLYNLVALLSMLGGVALALRVGKRNAGNYSTVILATILGALIRVVVMTPVNAVLLQFSPPLGFGLAFKAVLAILPPISFFNGTVALYTIPIAFIAARESGRRIRGLSQVRIETRVSNVDHGQKGSEA
ncbi:MAG: hypothetical protein M1587_03045 [Thaumarchaeota archaeon]|nr:hypothetical protein [Nitrososphaerota archaeon]